MKKLILVLSLILIVGCKVKDNEKVYKDYQTYNSITSFINEYKKSKSLKDKEVIVDGNVRYGTYNYVVLNYSDDVNTYYYILTLRLNQQLYWHNKIDDSIFKVAKKEGDVSFNIEVKSDQSVQQYMNCSNNIIIKNAPIFNEDSKLACTISSKKKLNK